MITKQKQLFEASTGGPTAKTPFNDLFAIGTVVDTNDPMQWGRVRVVVTAWGDSLNHRVDGMPWAMYVSPFGGQTSSGTRGPDTTSTAAGGISYGMWAIPKIGAQVLVISLDEDHQQRLYLGCVYDAFTTHTMPHGRWIAEDHPELKDDKSKSAPYGPYSSSDKLIQPLAGNLQQAFGQLDNNFEWHTRAADYSVSRLSVEYLHHTPSGVQDDAETKMDDWVYTQGYQVSRLDPHTTSAITGKNFDSQIYSFTSPGFHSMSMDDRMENCRMKFRTTTGHQILLDDTNERIYISTAQGNNWVEMDQAGNIDIFSSNKVSIRAAQDINITSDKSIRMHAKEGIHMHSDKEVRVNSVADLHIRSQQKMKIDAGSDINVKSGGELKLTSKGTTHINAGGNILETGSKIHLNGPAAASAESAEKALFTNRVPAHEPWARTMTKKDDSHDPELKYDDKNVGRMERGKPITRNKFWRR